MAIIIGCSGSTGSSLLKTILNRHSQIFAGPETNLFAFPKVYNQWERHRSNLLQGIQTDGWAVRNGMELLQDVYGWEAEALKNLAQNSPDFKNFVEHFFAKPLTINQKKYWIEKTPVNAYGFASFLDNYPTGKVIQIVRHPYDTMASLIARGMNAYWAAGYYVYNTAIATSVNKDQRYYQLKYEDLVAQPTATMEALFRFLKIPFEKSILVAKNEQRKEPTTMTGWKHHETGKVQSSSIGRFKELSLEQQTLIQTALSAFKIAPAYQERYQIRFADCATLCQELGYDFERKITKRPIGILRKQYWRSRLGRIRHCGTKAIFSFPGELSSL